MTMQPEIVAFSAIGDFGLLSTAVESAAEGGAAQRVIGLGLDEDLFSLRGTGALTYKNGAWQEAGLTSVDWGKAAVDNSWFRLSFKEAAQSADAIRFDVSSFDMAFPKPGMTSFELSHIVENPGLLQKTTFIRNGGQVFWTGGGFGP